MSGGIVCEGLNCVCVADTQILVGVNTVRETSLLSRYLDLHLLDYSNELRLACTNIKEILGGLYSVVLNNNLH